jgi:hypothetical protein
LEGSTDEQQGLPAANAPPFADSIPRHSLRGRFVLPALHRQRRSKIRVIVAFERRM